MAGARSTEESIKEHGSAVSLPQEPGSPAPRPCPAVRDP